MDKFLAEGHRAADSVLLTSDDRVVNLRPSQPDSEPVPARQRLREFEDRKFGPGVTRIVGQLERGYGAPIHRLSPAEKAEHAALEKLIAAEEQVAEATAALAKAQAHHATVSEEVDKHSEKAAEDGRE